MYKHLWYWIDTPKVIQQNGDAKLFSLKVDHIQGWGQIRGQWSACDLRVLLQNIFWFCLTELQSSPEVWIWAHQQGLSIKLASWELCWC